MREKSIMPPNALYETERREGLHRHEVFYGSAYRKKSIELGLYVFLTPAMHNMSDNGVHFSPNFDAFLKKIGQKTAMEKFGWSTEDFIREFGQNYLYDEEEDNDAG